MTPNARDVATFPVLPVSLPSVHRTGSCTIRLIATKWPADVQCVRSHCTPFFLINHSCGCCNCRCHCYCLSTTIRERLCPLVQAVLARAPLRPTGKHKLDLLLYFIFLFYLLLYTLHNASPRTCPSRTLALAVVSSGTVQVVPPGILSGTFQYRLLGVGRKTRTSSSDICKFPVLL